MDMMYSKIAPMQRQHTPITPQFVDVDWRWQIRLPLVGRFKFSRSSLWYPCP